MIFYGRNVAQEALRSSLFRSSQLILQKDINQDSKISELIQSAKQSSTPIKYIDRSEISKLTHSDEHQGVAVDVEYSLRKLSKLAVQDKTNAYIYISTATYEHNIGAITRTAEVAGFQGVIIPKNVSITPTIARTSAGAIFHIPIYSESIFNAIKKFEQESFYIFGIERGGQHYFDVDLTENSLFIIGGEDKSLSESVSKKCDNILTIPQEGSVNSLNMSVATAIVMFDRVRQLNIS